MTLVGASVLTDYADKNPRARSALRALNALLQQAEWTNRESFVCECGALIGADERGQTVLELRDGGCRVVLNINYQLGVVRITSVSAMKETRKK